MTDLVIDYLANHFQVQEWLHLVARDVAVYWPVAVGHQAFEYRLVNEEEKVIFDRIDHGHEEITFSASVCTLPPSRLLAPMQEPLYRYSPKQDKKGFRYEACLDDSERIIAGIRPCDLKAIALLDRVNECGVPDVFYLTRREHTTLIACNCLRPCDEYCFCQATDSLRWEEGADIFVTPLVNGQLLIECLTDRGISLCQDSGFTACDEAEKYRKEAEGTRPEPFGRQLKDSLPAVSETVSRVWDSTAWHTYTELCFSCGTCNLVCPTCYCFDIDDRADETNLDCGMRFRCADACMLPAFGEVAGGYNFRNKAASRQRHRVKRKFSYLPEKFSDSGSFCVGCGRCGHQCTADIDILNIVNELLTTTQN